MRPLIDEFLRELADGRQLSAHTVAAYRRDLGELTGFLETYFQSDEWEWSRVDRNALRRFLGHLANQRLARRTIARRLSAVRSFFRFLHR
ncbi:MAG TPA: site-specific integrase, partial [Longimicrobiales bacterium]